MIMAVAMPVWAAVPNIHPLRNEITQNAIGEGVRNLVICIHGWNNPSVNDRYQEPEWAWLVDKLKLQLSSQANSSDPWALLLYDWHEDAATGFIDFSGFDLDGPLGNAIQASRNAAVHGQSLGPKLPLSLRRVHIIAHSAGAWAARETALLLIENNPYVIVQVTLLDPFVPAVVKLFDPYSSERLEDLATHDRISILENYFADDFPSGAFEAPTLGTQEIFSWGASVNRINLQVDWDPNVFFSLTGKRLYYDWHSGPIQFYGDTISAVAGSPPSRLPPGITPYIYNFYGWYNSLFWFLQNGYLPKITSQPSKTTAAASGSPVTLTVQGSGSPPFDYKWFKRGQANPIVGAISSSYTFLASDTTKGDYVVCVSNSRGKVFSDFATVSLTADSTPPTAEIFTPTGGSVSGTATVTAIATDAVGVVNVEFYLDGVFKFTRGASPFTWSWNTTLANNGSHQLTVKAYNAAGKIGTSPPITVTVNNTGDISPPVISNVRASTTVNSATITWTTSEAANGQIEYGIAPCLPCASSSSLAPNFVTSHSIILTSLAPSTDYNYRVFGRDMDGNLAISASLSFRTATTPNTSPSVALGRPNGGESWAVGSAQAITWNAVDDVAVTSVGLFYTTDGGVNWNSIANGLANSGSYSWTVPNVPSANVRVMVLAFDGTGASGSDLSDRTFSIAAGCATPATPDLQSISVPPSGNYTVAWNPVTGADHYILEESATLDFSQVTSYNTTAPSRFIVGAPGTRYYRVRAVNNCGPSANSGTQTASVVVDQGPGEITAVSPIDNAAGQPFSVNLSWSVIHPGGEGMRYNVYVVPADTDTYFSANIKSAGQTASSFNVANLPYNTRVSWGIEAIDDTGQRRFSKMFHFTTIADSSAPTGSISINNGATTTDTYSVTLLPSASDSDSGVAYMRFSNDGMNWTYWERFAPQYPWNLADNRFGGRDGLNDYTVYGQFQDYQGNISAVYSDSITKVAGRPGNIILNGTFYTTIRDAVDVAQAGDTIFLTEGVFTVAGEASALRPHDPGRLVGLVLKPGVTLKGMGIQRTTIVFENSLYGVVDGTNSVIEGIKLLNPSFPSSTAACILIENSGSTIRNCWMTGSYYGVQVGWNAQKPGSNTTLENNLVTGNHSGIFVSYVSSNVVVRNNTIAFNLPNGGILSQLGSIQVENNIIASNGYQFSVPDGSLPTFRYNDVMPATSGVGYQGVPPQTGINGNISTDPLFANASSDDYRLSAGSLCIDRGLSVGIPFAGSAPDLGAFEFTGTGTIRVSANRTNATFVVTGPQASYSGSGTNWSIAGVPVGIYAIQFGPISNLYSPQYLATMLYSGQTVVFDGTYRTDATPPVGSFIINHSEFATAELLVTLSLDFTDEVAGMGTGAEMKFSNDGVNWSAPEPFSTVKRNWNLSAFGGTTTPRTNTVYGMVSDAFGNWGTFSNAVFYKPGRLVLEVPSQFASIQAALAAASSGDIVYVAPGNYNGSFTIPPGVTLRGAGPSNSIFNASSYLTTSANSVVEGFGGYLRVYATGGPTIIQNNRFERGNQQVVVSTKAWIRNNVFSTGYIGLLVDGSSSSTDVVVENNTLVGNSIALYLANAQPTTRTINRNNILAFNAIAVVDEGYNDRFHRHIVSSFNTYWSNTNGNFGELTPSQRNYYQLMEAGDRNEDPGFLNVTAGDYRLSAGSPCIGGGQPDLRFNDPDGSRSDRGAYGGPSVNTAPFANLTATPAVAGIGSFISFDASASFDKESDNSKLLLRWDFDGDGVWDTSFSVSKVVSLQFTNLGTFNVNVEVRDERGWLATTNRQIRIENQNPFTPSPLSIANNSTNQPVTLRLDWLGGDNDPFDTVVYDLYFGTAANPELVASDLNGASFSPPQLQYNKFYFWQVLARDNHGGVALSPVYSFLTQPESTPVAPTITGQPVSQTVAAGSNATFSVTATGTGPLAYQWLFNTTNVLAGATNAILTVTNAQPANSGNYAVVVTNMGGSVTSGVAVLTVLVPPSVVTQPTNTTANALSDAVISVNATGTAPLIYQWFKSGSVMTNATNATLTLPAVTTNSAGAYQVVITNVAGSVTSAVAVLTVNRLAQTITFGSLSAKRVDDAPLSLGATASSGLSVRYTSSNPGVATVSGNIVTVTGIGSTTITASQPGSAIYLPGADVSQTLVVSATGIPPSITTQPASVTVNVTSNATFSVTATGTAPLGYQWQFSTNGGGTWINLGNDATYTGVQTPTLTLNGTTVAMNGYQFRVVVSNNTGTSAASPAATLTVFGPYPPGVWTSGGPYGGNVRALAINPTTPATLYAGTDAGVFRSTDSGGTWAAANTGLTDLWVWSVMALAIDPTTPTTLYAGTWQGGVFKSTDSGGTWVAVNTGLTTLYVTSLAINPATPATLYVGTYDGGVFKSTDSGGTWVAVNTGLTTLYVTSLAINPATPATLYAGGYSGGVFKTTDSGGTWAAVNTGMTSLNVYALAINPTTPSTLYAGTWQGGVFKSTDSGGTWAAANAGPRYVSALAINPTTPSTLYAGTYFGVFKSTDAGSTWTAANTGLTTLEVAALAINPAAAILYAGTYASDHHGGVFKSTDSGGTWAAANTGLTYLEVRTLAINPATPTTLYAGTDDGVFKSTDSGRIWAAANTGLPSTYVYALAINPATPATLYAGTSAGVFKSTNSGGTWAAASTGLTSLKVYALAINPATPTTLYAGTDAGVFRSTDSGGTWAAANTGLTYLYVNALAINPATPTTLYAGTSGVFKSTDSGGTWVAVNTGLPPTATGLRPNVYSLVIDSTTPATLYAGANGYGVFKSTDAGGTWAAANTGLTSAPNVNALAINLVTPTTIYAGTSDFGPGGGVFKSTDAGGTWGAVNTGLPNIAVNALALDPTGETTLYAGLQGRSVWRLTANASATIPAITTQPMNQTVVAGTTVTLNVSALGQPAPAYQWLRDGTNLPSATAANLTLTNVTLNQSGLYSVVVTNVAGSITSAPAMLTVATSIFQPPAAQNAATIQSQGFGLSLMLETGRIFRVQFKKSFNEPNWTDLTNFTSTGMAFQFLDAAATNQTRRFYRVISP